MSRENCIEISFKSDNYLLKGILHLPKTKKPPVIVGSHGLESTCDSPKQIELANLSCNMGIAFFRFDHRGCGKSEGVFSEVTSVENRKNDLINAVNIVMNREDTGDRLALFGSSIGGTTCIAAAKELNAEAYVLIAAPVFGETLLKAPEELDEEPGLSIEFYKNLLQFDISENLIHLKNILIFHGDKDDIVPIINSETIYNKACEPKKYIIQKNGDHRISDPEDQKEFISEAADWYKRFLLRDVK